MRQGIFAIPASGGALTGQVLNQVVAFGKQLALPFPQYATGGDVSLIWWDPEVTGTSNIVASEGKGMWRYLDGAKRYLPGALPAGEPKFFDHRGHRHRVHDDPRVGPARDRGTRAMVARAAEEPHPEHVREPDRREDAAVAIGRGARQHRPVDRRGVGNRAAE